MLTLRDIRSALLVSLWFVFLTFPLMVIKVDPIERLITWRWHNMLFVGAGSFVLYLVSRAFLSHSGKRRERLAREPGKEKTGFILIMMRKRGIVIPLLLLLCVFALVFPHIFSTYQTNIMVTALMYVML
ncbi:MAG TPA: branched-chain amino acid ABC transporter permease, partial [Desulfobacteraceae bacterium]|nr:branched-chain amino acid ABC transporter permease [Desulfobacteraceae bacterium]